MAQLLGSDLKDFAARVPADAKVEIWQDGTQDSTWVQCGPEHIRVVLMPVVPAPPAA